MNVSSKPGKPSHSSTHSLHATMVRRIGFTTVAALAFFFGLSTLYLLQDGGARTIRQEIHDVEFPHIEHDHFLSHSKPWSFYYDRDANKFGLNERQCEAAFPKLYYEIDRALEWRKQSNITITPKMMDDNMNGTGALRVMIYNGRLFVVESIEAEAPLFGNRAMAFLHTLNRAIVSAPDPAAIPNIEFTMTMHDSTNLHYGDDVADRPIWSWTRYHLHDQIWVVPEFGKWTWAMAHIGSPDDVRILMQEVEDQLGRSARALGLNSYDHKIRKLLWRGNIETNHDLRQKLINVTKDKPWADVQGTAIDNLDGQVPIQQHCRWQYLAYTEGHSYSGRLKYLQNCHSVIIAHEMDWVEPWHAMLVPDGPDQNYVLVNKNFSNLEDKMTTLLKDTKLSRRIADNSVAVFRDRYLAPAAEACYWRRLIKAWREVSYEPDFYKWDMKLGRNVWRGFPFETYALTGKIGY